MPLYATDTPSGPWVPTLPASPPTPLMAPQHPWHPYTPTPSDGPLIPLTPLPPRSPPMPLYATDTPSGPRVPTLPASPPTPLMAPQHPWHPYTLIFLSLSLYNWPSSWVCAAYNILSVVVKNMSAVLWNSANFCSISPKICTPKLQLLHNTKGPTKWSGHANMIDPRKNFYIRKTFYPGG